MNICTSLSKLRTKRFIFFVFVSQHLTSTKSFQISSAKSSIDSNFASSSRITNKIILKSIKTREKVASTAENTSVSNKKILNLFSKPSTQEKITKATDNSSSSSSSSSSSLWNSLQNASEKEDKVVVNIKSIALVTLGLVGAYIFQTNPSLVSAISHPTETIQSLLGYIQSLEGSTEALFYFAVVYTIAEMLAVPATPLTLSAGYLFGIQDGVTVVWCSAILSATLSFLIARNFLRKKVEELLVDYPQFQKIDKAIGKEGFRLLFLIRLSPIFPFSISNYLYGVSSVQFSSYFWATALGFLPGTLAYVYTGMVGKAFFNQDTAMENPTYLLLGLVLIAGFVKVLADVATSVIQELDEDS